MDSMRESQTRKREGEIGLAHSKWLVFRRIIQLVIQLKEHMVSFIYAKEKCDDVPFARQTRFRWPIRAPTVRCRRHHGQSRMQDLIPRAQGRTRRVN